MEAWYKLSNGLCDNAFLFCLFSHEVANISVAEDSVFAYRRKIEKVIFQVFKKFSMTLNVSEESSPHMLLHGPFFTQRKLVGKVFTEMLLDDRISSLQTLMFMTLWHEICQYCLLFSPNFWKVQRASSPTNSPCISEANVDKKNF